MLISAQRQPAGHHHQELATGSDSLLRRAAGWTCPCPLQWRPRHRTGSHQGGPAEGPLGSEQDCQVLLHGGVRDNHRGPDSHQEAQVHKLFISHYFTLLNFSQCRKTLFSFNHWEGAAIFSFKRPRLSAATFRSASPPASAREKRPRLDTSSDTGKLHTYYSYHTV